MILSNDIRTSNIIAWRRSIHSVVPLFLFYKELSSESIQLFALINFGPTSKHGRMVPSYLQRGLDINATVSILANPLEP